MATDPNFRMPIEDAFTITGRGTVAVGRVALGTVNVGDQIFLKRDDGAHKTAVLSIQAGATVVKSAAAGDLIGVVLRRLSLEDIRPGSLLSGSES